MLNIPNLNSFPVRNGLFEQIVSKSQNIAALIERLSLSKNSSLIVQSQSAKALITSILYGTLFKKIVVICPDDDNASIFYEDVLSFSRLLYEKIPIILNYPSRPENQPQKIFEDYSEEALRTKCLSLMFKNDPFILVAGERAIRQKVLPKNVFKENSFTLKNNSLEPLEELKKKLFKTGYSFESNTEKPSHASFRGGLIDIFSPSENYPVRVEFDGDKIDSLRLFDPYTQLTIKNGDIDEYTIIPAREILIHDLLPQAKKSLREIADNLGTPKKKRKQLFDILENPDLRQISSDLLPAFYSELANIQDYMSDDTSVISVNGYQTHKNSLAGYQSDFETYENDIDDEKIVYPVDRLYLTPDELKLWIKKNCVLDLPDLGIDLAEHENAFSDISEINYQDSKLKPSEFLADLIKRNNSNKIQTYFFSESFDHANKTNNFLKGKNILSSIDEKSFGKNRNKEKNKNRTVFTKGRISKSFLLKDCKICFIDETSLFGRKRYAETSESSASRSILNLSTLKPGDFVVHDDLGIARYDGLKHIKVAGVESDFLLLTFAGEDKLYMPIYRMNLIHRYIGSGAKNPRLSRLGSSSWENLKSKAKKAIAGIATELVKLYASRKIMKGYAYSEPDDSYNQFESLFPFEETPDQRKAVEDVIGDLKDSKPMDRLICGDVGYGKTEVAIRASYIAAMEGKQTAVLVPTTVLAQQHYENFKKRYLNYPVEIDYLSRFKTKSLQKQTVSQIENGKIDIIIGTHRLLSSDIKFKDLGLLIIDEEHRFGVKHKEKIKKYRSMVDVMALSATPIPRSLEMSLVGLRDLSLINTAPLDRKSIKTSIAKYDENLIKEACLREINRGGQVFFVHNRIETINNIHSNLKKILPEAKIVVAHGRMKEDKLEKVMIDFLEGRYDILLSTAIIESGLDISRANTIIINRADMLGLAQLYQLRGRVGRSKELAYAYLLLPQSEVFSDDAVKRLKVLKNFTDLGSGIKVALHDLEIRGAGNIFGESQSGHVTAIGLEMYTKILEKTIKKLKGQPIDEEGEPQMKINIEAFIQDSYISDVSERLSYYRRISNARNDKEIDIVSSELINRFGNLPLKLKLLLKVASLKISAKKLKLCEIYVDKKNLYFRPEESKHTLTESIISALKSNILKYTKDGRVRLELKGNTVYERLKYAKKMLQGL